MGKQRRRLGLRKETLVTLGGLDAAALARVVGGGGNGSVVCSAAGGGDAANDDAVPFTASGQSLSGSRKC